jgi:signal transduction histidine kinase
MHPSVTADSEAARPRSTTHPTHPTRPLAADTPAFAALRSRVATALQSQADGIAARWEAESRVASLHEPSGRRRAGALSLSPALVASLAAVLSPDGPTPDSLVALGLAVGSDAFELGGSLHDALGDVDLLTGMMLHVVETSVANETDASAADGVRVSRQLQQASSRLTLAVAKGFTQAMAVGMRDRFRQLRHDLRNPLGTIRSVLAIIDDETISVEEREHPRFRAMARRNAWSLGELITERLSDVEAAALVGPVLPVQGSSRAQEIATQVRAAGGADRLPADGPFSGDRDVSHDVRRPHEREHGQPGAL